MKILIALLLSSGLIASELTAIKISGEKKAEISFVGLTGLPVTRQNQNTLEFTFSDSELSENYKEKLDIESPHALIRRVSAFPLDKKSIKVIMVMNGSMENIKNRFQLQKSSQGVSMVLEYPKVESATLELLKEEQAPLFANDKKVASTDSQKSNYLNLVWAIIVVVFAGFSTYFIVRFMKAKGAFKGSRKYLIEQLGYCALGPKAGVSLLKIGKEFVLLGVTQNQINILSSLPKLQDDYDEDSKFETGVFKEAVEEEYRRVHS